LKQGECVKVWSRRGEDFTYRFPTIAEAVRGLSVDRALIDGEAVVLTSDGRSDFEALMTKRGGAQASLVACRRLMTIPGVGQPTALAFVAEIDDPAHPPIARCRRLFGPGSRRHQSGELDYVSGISKCGTGACETLLYEAANVMLTRYKGQLQTQ
jgi:transposase